MKIYEVIYFDSLGGKVAIQVRARSEAGAFKAFRKDYGGYTVYSITEVK